MSGRLDLGPVVLLLHLAVRLHRDVGLGGLSHLKLHLADPSQQFRSHLGLRLGCFHGLNGGFLIQLRIILNLRGRFLGNFRSFLKGCFRTGLGGRIAKFLELNFRLSIDRFVLFQLDHRQRQGKGIQGFDFRLLQFLFGPFWRILRRDNFKRYGGQFHHEGIRKRLSGRRFGRSLRKLGRFLKGFGDLKRVQVLHLGKLGGLLPKIERFLLKGKSIHFQIRLHDGGFSDLDDLLNQFLETEEQGQYHMKQDRTHHAARTQAKLAHLLRLHPLAKEVVNGNDAYQKQKNPPLRIVQKSPEATGGLFLDTHRGNLSGNGIENSKVIDAGRATGILKTIRTEKKSMPFQGKAGIHFIRRRIDGSAQILGIKDFSLKNPTTVKIEATLSILTIGTEIEEISTWRKGRLPLIGGSIEGMDSLRREVLGSSIGFHWLRRCGKQVVIILFETSLADSSLPSIFLLLREFAPGPVGRKVNTTGNFLFGGIIFIEFGIYFGTKVDRFTPIALLILQRQPKVKAAETILTIRGEEKSPAIISKLGTRLGKRTVDRINGLRIGPCRPVPLHGPQVGTLGRSTSDKDQETVVRRNRRIVKILGSIQVGNDTSRFFPYDVAQFNPVGILTNSNAVDVCIGSCHPPYEQPQES